MEVARSATGREPGLRFRVPTGEIEFRDEVRGDASFDVERDVGDFLVMRRGGLPAYQLAVVVDDAADGVTEIVRGDDLLPSTARQLLLARALGLTPPRWWHVPLVLDGSGRRLAKREKDLGLEELRARGADPRAVVVWAARSAGAPIEARGTAREVLRGFTLETLSREPVTLDAGALAALLEARP